jgi:hypothetical protein
MSVAERNQLILMLASYIRRRRQAMAMSVERAAELTGIKTSDWCVLEAGWVPEDESKLLQAVASTLEIGYLQLSFIAEASRYNQEFLLSSPQPRAS